MATVYKIEIKTVSAWVNHPPEYIEKVISKLLENNNSVHFENTEIIVKRE
jgi:hypothetical protein